jgi:Trk-type K+ transport system membrane component
MMIPMIMRLDIRKRDERRVRLFFPLIVLWIVVFALLIVALPFVLLAALFTLRRGPGIRILQFFSALFAAVFALSGLRVDVANREDSKVFISFD